MAQDTEPERRAQDAADPFSALRAPEWAEAAFDAMSPGWREAHARAIAAAKLEADAKIAAVKAGNETIRAARERGDKSPELRETLAKWQRLGGTRLDGPEHAAFLAAAERLRHTMRRMTPRRGDTRRAPRSQARRAATSSVSSATSSADGPPGPEPPGPDEDAASSALVFALTGICGHHAGALVCSRVPDHAGKHSDGWITWSTSDVRSSDVHRSRGPVPHVRGRQRQ